MTAAAALPWLPALAAALLLTGCNAGEKPGSQATGTALARNEVEPWFREAAVERGIDFVHESGHGEHYLMPEIMAGGAALFDADGDGDLDAYLVQGGSLKGAPRHFNQLYLNKGAGRFENATAGSGSGDGGYGMGVAAADYDGDGDSDLYVTNVGANTLLQNDGRGRFADVTAAARVGDRSWGAGAAFLDYDGDGDLDLFAANYIDWSMETRKECANSLGGPDYCSPQDYNAPVRDLLYRNNGDGSFTDVSLAAGLDAAFGNGLGVVCGDFDGDGRSDIFVANDGVMNQLWMNRGDGTFVDQALLRGCALDESGIAKAGMGVSAVDVDDNATLDLLVVNLESETDSFYRNEGTYFTDATAAVGLAWGSHLYTRFGVGLLDFDNDGLLDLYAANGRIDRGSSSGKAGDPFAEPNLLFSGGPDGRFEEVLPRGGTSELLVATSRAAAFGDVDDDGGIDVLVVNRDAPAHLLRNVVAARGGWIAFRVLNERGSDALGAVVTFAVGETGKTREVRTAYSYLAANDARIHVGLGAAAEVSGVVVRWPGGPSESFGAFEGGSTVTLRQGSGAAE